MKRTKESRIVKESIKKMDIRLLNKDGKELDMEKFISKVNKSNKDEVFELQLEYKDEPRFIKIFHSLALNVISPYEAPILMTKLEQYMEYVFHKITYASFAFVASLVFPEYEFFYDVAELYSDEIIEYKKLLVGMRKRFPDGFINTIKKSQIERLFRYCVFFVAGYDENTIVELRKADIVKGKLQTVLIKYKAEHNGTYLDIINDVCKFDVKPWEILNSIGRKYSEQDIIDAIDNIILEKRYSSIDSVTTNDVNAYAPGLYATFKKNGTYKGAISRLRQFYIEHKISNIG